MGGTAMKRFYLLLAAPVAVLGLGACTEMRAVGQAVGVVPTKAQQEYNTVNARLSLPPDFNLRPPQKGSGAALSRAATSRGRQAILGDQSPATVRAQTITQETRSAGESALLRRASGNQPVAGDIRSVVDTEVKDTTKPETRFTDKLLKWRAAPEGKPGKSGDDANKSKTRPAARKNVPRITKLGGL